jgi:hypothetical protein
LLLNSDAFESASAGIIYQPRIATVKTTVAILFGLADCDGGACCGIAARGAAAQMAKATGGTFLDLY